MSYSITWDTVTNMFGEIPINLESEFESSEETVKDFIKYCMKKWGLKELGDDDLRFSLKCDGEEIATLEWRYIFKSTVLYMHCNNGSESLFNAKGESIWI